MLRLMHIEYMRYELLRSMMPASVSLSVTPAGCAKTAERIDVLFGLETLGNPRHIALDGGHHPTPRTDSRIIDHNSPHLMYYPGGGCSVRPLPNYFGHLLHRLCNLHSQQPITRLGQLTATVGLQYTYLKPLSGGGSGYKPLYGVSTSSGSQQVRR